MLLCCYIFSNFKIKNTIKFYHVYDNQRNALTGQVSVNFLINIHALKNKLRISKNLKNKVGYFLQKKKIIQKIMCMHI